MIFIRNNLRKFCFLLLLVLVLLQVTEANAADLNTKAGIVTTTSGALNVRKDPSSTSAKVGSLTKGSYVTLLSKSGSWWQVEYAKGMYGYCHSDYITVATGTPVTVNTVSGNLNVRTGAGTSFNKSAALPKGETVIALSDSGEWKRILYHGTKTGYVNSRYLSSYYPSVALWVPDMKQTDSRWANTVIGTSGKTMAQIGCATTAIAMLESHRTGIRTYPDVMASRLKYTPGGSVYWPDHYTTITDTSHYLSRIYQLLKLGKPVLFGAQNTYGSQHWVVITGFTGGTSLTAAGFTIKDPGSWSRTNLQQFLNAYPTVYKYFHY